EAVRAVAQGGKPNDRVAFNAVSPPVKALRAISQLLHDQPALAIESVAIEGFSGCSDYVGHLDARVAGAAKPKRFEFAWDCKWKAEQLGWKDAFGYPDQMRAAREHGWDCFKTWKAA